MPWQRLILLPRHIFQWQWMLQYMAGHGNGSFRDGSESFLPKRWHLLPGLHLKVLNNHDLK